MPMKVVARLTKNPCQGQYLARIKEKRVAKINGRMSFLKRNLNLKDIFCKV